MNLVGLALRNLKRRPIRTCLSILGIGLAVGSALALIALSRSIQDSTREGMDEIGDDLVVMQKGSSDIFGGFIPEETVDRIAALPGVGRAGHVCPERLRQKRAHARMARRELPVEEGPPAREPRAGRGRAPRRGARRHRGGLLGQEARRRSGADRPDLPCRRHRRLHHDRQSRAGAGAVDRPAGSELPPRQVTILHVNVEHASGRAELGSVRVAIEALGKVTASTANEVLNNDRNFAILEAVSLAVSIIAVAMSALNAHRAGDGDAGAYPRDRHLRGDRVEQRAHHDVDRDRGNIDVRERLRPRRAVELACHIRVSAHSGNRQPDLVQAERRPDRAGRRCSLRALRSRGAVAGVAGGSDGTCGGAAAPVSARQRRGRAGGSES